ncbi:MAG TPA: CBS domain-containing protein [Longimicrobiales bacterium]|nr:CBS domain-containing protein [Longimicrobiales bacterium]
MSAGRICTRVIHTADGDETVRAAAARMDREGVGTLVVVDDALRPIGIVTDRDVVVRCVSPGLDPDRASVSEIMSVPVSSVFEDTPIESALRMMAGSRARRSVVVNRAGALVGVLALDDVLELLAEEVEAIGELVRVQAVE